MTREIKVILAIAAGILILGGVLSFNEYKNPGDNTITENDQSAVLEARQTEFDFGDISMKNGKVSNFYKIKNVTAEPVEVKKVYTSCMCTEAFLIVEGRETGPFGMPAHGGQSTVRQLLQPGQEAEVKALYDPNAHGPAGIGPAEREIVIETKQGAPLILTFSANVTP